MEKKTAFKYYPIKEATRRSTVIENETLPVPIQVKENNHRHKKALKKCWEVLRYLEHTCPLLFSRAPFKPLKRGILEELIATKDFPFSKTRLRSALRLYTHLQGYLECFEIYFERYDLRAFPVILSPLLKKNMWIIF